jgi:hypothetical protein
MSKQLRDALEYDKFRAQSIELRIGNWVEEYNPHHPQYKNFVKVESVNEEGINLIGSVDYDCGIIEANPCINPIPLTPELLVKCGFELTYNKTNHKRCEISVGEDGFKLEFNWRKEALEWTEFKITGNGGYDDGGEMSINDICKHLHQLQNLYFALTGEELSIEL